MVSQLLSEVLHQRKEVVEVIFSEAPINQPPTIFYVDDDPGLRESVKFLVESEGDLRIETFPSAAVFLKTYHPYRSGCLLLDLQMPEMTGLELQEYLHEQGVTLPIIFITGHGDVPAATRAMKAGAMEFLMKPFDSQELLSALRRALDYDEERRAVNRERQVIAQRVSELSQREKEVLEYLMKGYSNKAIAETMGLSQKTIEMHRSKIMKKMEAKTVAQLIGMIFLYEGTVNTLEQIRKVQQVPASVVCAEQQE